VFQALTDGDQLARWLGADVTIDPREGGHYRFELIYLPAGRHSGKVTTFEPGRVFGFSMVAAQEMTYVTFTLTALPGGLTRVDLLHEGFPTVGDPDDPSDVPECDELRCLWRYRLHALRALIEQGVELYDHTDAVPHLHGDVARAKADLLAAPRDVFALLREEAEANGEVVLAVREPTRLVTLRHLSGPRAPSIITADVTRRGAGVHVFYDQQGFSAEETFWSHEDRIIRIPTLALLGPDEQQRLERRLAQIQERLEPLSIEIVRRIRAPKKDTIRALTDAQALACWLPGFHTTPAAPGERLGVFAIADQPVEAQDGGREPQWPGLVARLLGQDLEARTATIDYDVESDGGPIPGLDEPGVLRRPLSFEISTEDELRMAILRVTHTGYRGEEDASVAARARWEGRVEQLQRTLEGRFVFREETTAPKELVLGSLVEPFALASWLDDSILAEDRGFLLTPRGVAGERHRVRLLEKEADHVELSWPLGTDDPLARPVRVAVRTSPRSGAALGELGTGCVFDLAIERVTPPESEDRLAWVARERRRWAFRALSLRARTEGERGLSDLAPFGHEFGPAGIRLSTTVFAPASSVFDAILDPKTPLIGLPTAEEVIAVDQFSGGRFEFSFGEGRIVRADVDRRIEHTFPALGPDEPEGPTLVRWSLTQLGAAPAAMTRVELSEAGFGTTGPWMLRQVRQRRAWRFALEELRTRLEAGATLRRPGLVESIACGSVTCQRDLAVPPSEVYAALVTGEGLARWLCESATIDPKPAGTLRLVGVHEPLPRVVAGLMLRVIEDCSVEWLLPSPIDGATQVLRLFLEPREGRTRLYLRHQGFRAESEAHREAQARLEGPGGWPALLDRLAVAVEEPTS
jgi:uncharacterized protein YndB with AHSA1/START domain